MAWQQLNYRWTSLAPLIHHNIRLFDPLDYYTKEIAKITKKTKKTEADHFEISRLEFYGGIYIDETGPIIPANMVEGVIVAGARKFREGPSARAGMYAVQHASLEYDGPRTVDELWDNGESSFKLRVPAVLQGKRVMRTRPIFREWAANITVAIEDTLVNPADLDKWLTTAGFQIGAGDWHPKHGRFTSERIKNGKKG